MGISSELITGNKKTPCKKKKKYRMTFASELWDKYDIVMKHVDNGRKFSDTFAKYAQNKSNTYKDLARKLISFCSVKEIETGSLSTAWEKMKAEETGVSTAYGEMADNLIRLIHTPITTFLKDTSKQKSALKKTSQEIDRRIKK